MAYLVNFIFLSGLLPPMVIMTVMYGFIFCTTSPQLTGGVSRAAKSSAYYIKEKKLASSLALVLALELELEHYRLTRLRFHSKDPC